MFALICQKVVRGLLTPINTHQMVYLVLGDGNFSFSLSLCEQLSSEPNDDSVRVVATSYESQERVLQRARTGDVLKRLSECPGVLTLHSVDATKLEECEDLKKLGLQYSAIVFNFPHTGGKGRIEQNRALLKEFFISVAKSTFLCEGGEILLSLCRGQGGTPLDPPQRGYENSWKACEMAAEGGFVLSRVEPFPASRYPDYVPTGYRGHTDKGFRLEGALRYAFKYPCATRMALYPLQYQHDVSFWCTLDSFEEEKLKSFVRRVGGEWVKDISRLDQYRPSETGTRIGYCYRVLYGSDWDALARSAVAELQMVVRKTLTEEMGVELR